MKVKREIREERKDVVSFWEEKKVLNELDEIEIKEVKIDESTKPTIQKRIEDMSKQLETLQVNLELEITKLTLVEELEAVELEELAKVTPEVLDPTTLTE